MPREAVADREIVEAVGRPEGLRRAAEFRELPPQFGDLSYAGEGYYEATNEGGFNTSALVTTSGEAVTPFEYSDFDVLSPNWAIGVVLEGTNDKDASDYTVIFGEYDYAVIVRNDVFYLPEKKLVGTLERFNDGKRAEEADRVKHGIS